MISACFTTYNRDTLLFEAVEPFLKDERITEVVISDDHSTEEIYQTILWKYNGVEKVKIFRNEVNVDCYFNKQKAVERATNEWLLLLDSDNRFSKEFIDVIFEQRRDKFGSNEIMSWNKHWAYAPSFAKPHFDFRAIQDFMLSNMTVGHHVDKGSCSTMLNAANYFVNREEYLRVWDGSVNPVTSDSIFQNYNWLKAGNVVYVVPGLEYDHVVHSGSHYQQNVRRTPSGFHDSIIEKLKQMR